MVDGQRIHRVIGMESDGVTREQAENAIEKLRTEAREGRLNLPKGRKIALGFQEATAKYLDKSTAITHLVQAGVDLPTVQRISGHKTLQMVVRYSHQNGEHIRAAMDKLEDRYHPTETKASTVTPIVKLSAVNSRE